MNMIRRKEVRREKKKGGGGEVNANAGMKHNVHFGHFGIFLGDFRFFFSQLVSQTAAQNIYSVRKDIAV